MTYFYMALNSTHITETEIPVDWNSIFHEKYGRFESLSERIRSTTQMMSLRASEMFQWCCDHLKTYEVYKTGHSQWPASPGLAMWMFYIPDPIEAIAFKLRWASE